MVLYGYEMWSLMLREEHGLRVFENGAEDNVWTKEGSSVRVEKTV
jgi:hypothetical protein